MRNPFRDFPFPFRGLSAIGVCSMCENYYNSVGRRLAAWIRVYICLPHNLHSVQFSESLSSKLKEWTPTNSAKPHTVPLKKVHNNHPFPSQRNYLTTKYSNRILQHPSNPSSRLLRVTRLSPPPPSFCSPNNRRAMDRNPSRHRPRDNAWINPLATSKFHGLLPREQFLPWYPR
jgi:hypothetical protein